MTLLLATVAYSQDRYFKEDFYTGARYLKLGVDGRYELVDREHAGVWIADRGHWGEEDDGTLVFVSNRHVKDIVTALGRVAISGAEGPSLLPSLRSKLSELLERSAQGEEVPASAVSALEISSDGGRVSVELDPAVAALRAVPGDEIQSLLNAIDRYLLSQRHHLLRRRLEACRGITFLASLEKSACEAKEYRAEIDERNGRVPAYVFAEITEDSFKREIQTAYPFRFLRFRRE